MHLQAIEERNLQQRDGQNPGFRPAMCTLFPLTQMSMSGSCAASPKWFSWALSPHRVIASAVQQPFPYLFPSDPYRIPYRIPPHL